MNTFIQKLINWIAAGQSPKFTANASHFLLGAVLVLMFPLHAVVTALAVLVYAAVKEFWFDATYEKNPPQTALDNLEDFIGYVAGAASAVLFLRFFY